MRIGILTLPFNNNYGGYLQAYALMTVLKQMGHDVELIFRRHNRPTYSQRIRYFLRGIVRLLLGRKPVSFCLSPESDFKQRGQACIPFLETYIIPRTRPIYTTAELQKLGANYDAIVVGSDQVWRPEYVPRVEEYFLCFIENHVKRLSYAASFGTDEPIYTSEQRRICGRLFSLFDAISLRESSGIEIIQSFGWGNKDPQLVLDPTMLIPVENYQEIARKIPVKIEPHIFSYILDSDSHVQSITERISSISGWGVQNILDGKHWQQRDYIMPSVERWLAGFRDASFVVTDSFHGTVFCILFNKPFMVIANEGRGKTRFETLLSVFGLENRMVSSVGQVDDVYADYIDYKSVNERLKKRKEESLGFLHTHL